MKGMSYVKKMIITAVCIALCVVLPMAFHAVQNAGSIFLPMHIPVLLCGLICGWPFSLICGVVGPLVSSLITSMPPMAMLPFMMLELGVYALVAGLVFRFIKTGKIYADLYISLVAAMVVGRIISGIARAITFTGDGAYSIAMWGTAYFVTGLPGIIIQLVLIPTIVFALMKAKLIPEKYPKN